MGLLRRRPRQANSIGASPPGSGGGALAPTTAQCQGTYDTNT